MFGKSVLKLCIPHLTLGTETDSLIYFIASFHDDRDRHSGPRSDASERLIRVYTAMHSAALETSAGSEMA